MPRGHRARLQALLLALPLVLALGLAARFGLGGWPADAAGGALYTALVYLLAALARPGLHPARLALFAFAFSTAIELFQLTPYPQDLADAFSPSRLLLGTSFAATDLPPYAIGAALSALVDGRFAHRTPAP